MPLLQGNNNGAITVEPSVAGYGTMIFPGEMAGFVKGTAELTKEEVDAIENVCAFVGSRKVTELKRLATAS